jgi:hypothetical protein
MKMMSYVFWQVPTFVDQITTGKKSTVIWPSQTTVPSFLVVSWNLIKEQRNPPKNIATTPPKQSNIATNGQTTVPFFPVVI